VSLKLIPLTENPFGFVIVTVIVVVLVPPICTVEGLNDFAIVIGTPWAASDEAPANARMIIESLRSVVTFPGSRGTSMDSAPFSFLEAIESVA
jgi:hypothetical protein